MQVDRRQLISSLQAKGFVKEEGDHTFLYHQYLGKRTGPYAKVSHGSSHKVIGDSLIKLLKKQLQLNSHHQAFDLCRCPMSHADYLEILRTKGIL